MLLMSSSALWRSVIQVYFTLQSRSAKQTSCQISGFTLSWCGLMGSTAGGSRLAAVLAQWLDQIEAAGYINDARLRSRKLISSQANPGPFQLPGEMSVKISLNKSSDSSQVFCAIWANDMSCDVEVTHQ